MQNMMDSSNYYSQDLGYMSDALSVSSSCSATSPPQSYAGLPSLDSSPSSSTNASPALHPTVSPVINATSELENQVAMNFSLPGSYSNYYSFNSAAEQYGDLKVDPDHYLKLEDEAKPGTMNTGSSQGFVIWH